MELFAMNKNLLLIGSLALLAGTMEYLTNRPLGSAHFLSEYESIHVFFHRFPGLYGKLGLYAPEYFHPLAFSLLSAAFLSGRKSKMLACIPWFVTNVVFELGQTFGNELFQYLPRWFLTFPIIEGFVKFLVHGTFDTYDLAAICLGSLTAFLVVLLNGEKGGKNE